MNERKYTLNEIMTIKEASERFNINQQTLKNKLKPSIIGQEKIEEWVSEGLIRQSSTTWLLTEKFIVNNFKKLT